MGLKFRTLADDIETYSRAHHRDQRNILSRLVKVRPDFDERIADGIKPQEIDAWLSENTNTPATSNRCRALFNLIFREALRNGKVASNPARLVRRERRPHTLPERRRRKGSPCLIAPARLPELDISLGTGMRLSEQYGLTWGSIDLVRKEVRLVKSENNSARINQ